MTVSYINLLRAQQKPHRVLSEASLQEPGRRLAVGVSERDRQINVAQAARGRLWGRPRARPGANLPRTSTTVFRNQQRPAVDVEWAMKLVCEDQQVSPTQIMSSTYSAAVAARHMLWTVLLDGGHPVMQIARIFSVDDSTVRGGIKSFRDFQRDSLA
jgi:hypothetical protein